MVTATVQKAALHLTPSCRCGVTACPACEGLVTRQDEWCPGCGGTITVDDVGDAEPCGPECGSLAGTHAQELLDSWAEATGRVALVVPSCGDAPLPVRWPDLCRVLGHGRTTVTVAGPTLTVTHASATTGTEFPVPVVGLDPSELDLVDALLAASPGRVGDICSLVLPSWRQLDDDEQTAMLSMGTDRWVDRRGDLASTAEVLAGLAEASPVTRALVLRVAGGTDASVESVLVRAAEVS